jgi:hypothetical protein
VTCPPGCALCGELVTAPHYCVASYDRAHAAWCWANARDRGYLAQESAKERQREYAPPDVGLAELAAWGDWFAKRLGAFAPEPSEPPRAVAATDARVRALPPEHALALWRRYVERGESRRYPERHRALTSRGPWRPRPLEFTAAERAFLRTR